MPFYRPGQPLDRRYRITANGVPIQVPPQALAGTSPQAHEIVQRGGESTSLVAIPTISQGRFTERDVGQRYLVEVEEYTRDGVVVRRVQVVQTANGLRVVLDDAIEAERIQTLIDALEQPLNLSSYEGSGANISEPVITLSAGPSQIQGTETQATGVEGVEQISTSTDTETVLDPEIIVAGLTEDEFLQILIDAGAPEDSESVRDALAGDLPDIFGF